MQRLRGSEFCPKQARHEMARLSKGKFDSVNI